MNNRDIIVIGGSAGAVPPLTQLLAALPEDLPAAVLVAIHLSPLSAEWLSGYLRKHIALPVHSPLRDVEVRPGCVIVARPDHHLVLREGRAIASRGPRENLWRPAIDVLFRSAAAVYGGRVIGVLLSGELDDGTAGLQAIKACGGAVLIQTPEQATSPAMPRIAESNVAVDQSAPIEDLAVSLSRLSREDAPPQAPIPEQLKREASMGLAPEDSAALMSERGPPSALSCPECGGPLWRNEAGEHFRCMVGHAFHIRALAEGAEQEIDRTLWAAIRLFEQRVNISRMLAGQERSQGRQQRAELYESRARESHEYAANLRKLHPLRSTLSDNEWEAPADDARKPAH